MKDSKIGETLEEKIAEFFEGDEYAAPELMKEWNLLTDAAKDALDYWVRSSFEEAGFSLNRDSYSLKADFGDEGFYVTDAQFSVAMINAGYVPTAQSVKENPRLSKDRKTVQYGNLNFKVKRLWRYSTSSVAEDIRLETTRVRLVLGWKGMTEKLFRVMQDGITV